MWEDRYGWVCLEAVLEKEVIGSMGLWVWTSLCLTLHTLPLFTHFHSENPLDPFWGGSICSPKESKTLIFSSCLRKQSLFIVWCQVQSECLLYIWCCTALLGLCAQGFCGILWVPDIED